MGRRVGQPTQLESNHALGGDLGTHAIHTGAQYESHMLVPVVPGARGTAATQTCWMLVSAEPFRLVRGYLEKGAMLGSAP